MSWADIFKAIQQGIVADGKHKHNASDVTEGMLGGEVKANATAVTSLSTSQVRNISIGTTEMVAGTSTLACGDFYAMLEV